MILLVWCGSNLSIFNLFIVQVHVKRSVVGKEDNLSGESGEPSHLTKPLKPLVRKSKLVVVDLAGSERVHKSGLYPELKLSLF